MNINQDFMELNTLCQLFDDEKLHKTDFCDTWIWKLNMQVPDAVLIGQNCFYKPDVWKYYELKIIGNCSFK